MSRTLFKEAIAEAKSVREAAITNAKRALEESITPHLKSMLAAKLQEMEEVDEEEIEEATDAGFSKVSAGSKNFKKLKEGDVASGEEEIEEATDAGFSKVSAGSKNFKKLKEEEEEEGEDVEGDEALGDEEELPDEAPEGEEELPDEAPEGGEDDVEIGELTVEEFKDLIRDVIAQEMGGGVEGMGDEPEMVPGSDLDTGDLEGGEGGEEDLGDTSGEEDEEEIDLDELLRELEGMSKTKVEAKPSPNISELKKRLNTKTKELNEAVRVINSLKRELQEINLLNSKLLYVNKIFKAKDNLTESQKVDVITTFDKAESVKEAKLIYETVSKSLSRPPKKTNVLRENRGTASKATGLTGKAPEVIGEVSETVRRMQKLAGIIK